MKTTRKITAFFAMAMLALFTLSCGKDSLVQVTTNEPTDITATTAVCSGEFTFTTDEIGPFTVGICWSTSSRPNHNDQSVTYPYQQEPFVMGQPNPWECVITGLQPNTKYYVRAFVHPSHDDSHWGNGYHYGDQVTFTTAGNGESGNVMDGAVNARFSVSGNKKVYFSKGNLQYQASTNTWRFAERQWDYVGDENTPSSTDEGWIDLFGWATSGYYYDGICHYPWMTSLTGGYEAYGDHYANLDDETGEADWGYNAISNGGNRIGQWRTLSEEEWNYLLSTRNTASGIRFAKGTVNGVCGVILLPDDWNSSIYALTNPNNADFYSAAYEDNVVSEETWISVIEPAGAVFLPAAGNREDHHIYYANAEGHYWTSNGGSIAVAFGHQGYAVALEFGNSWLHTNAESRWGGRSVRLVHEAD